MKTNHVLLLGSKSQSRQTLLRQAAIPFMLVDQDADETACDWNLPLPKVVESIALHKMEHVIVPDGKEGDVCFVLTADTLSQDAQGAIHGKPTDRDDAVAKIKAARGGMRTGTAFCLDRKICKSGKWVVDERIQQYVQASYEFAVPDAWIDTYLEQSYGLICSGAIAIEEYGGLFLKSVEGSYTTIVGLPLYELRQALQEIGFFK